MKLTILTAIILMLLTPAGAFGQNKQPSGDQLKIEQVIENWNEAWRTKDYKLASRDYAEDADWTNAFGMTRKGRAEIERVLSEVFALPFVMAGDSETVEQSVSFIKPDVAMVVTRVERKGQQLSSGAALGTRRTSHLRVMTRSGKRWQIVSHLISDARETQQPKH